MQNHWHGLLKFCILNISRHSLTHSITLEYKYQPTVTDRSDLLWFIFLSPPALPVLCPRTYNLMASFLPEVFIPLTSHLPFTVPLYSPLPNRASAFSILTNPDTTPNALPGCRLIVWAEQHKVPQQRSPVAIGQAC